MRLKNLDLIVAMIFATINVVWTLLPRHIHIVGIIIALPVVFILPGYLLTEALFYKRSLEVSHRIVFSFGLSLTVDILGGLILNMLPTGLNALSWAMFLGLLTAVFSFLVTYLRREVPLSRIQLLRFRLRFYEYLLLGVATSVTILAILYASNGATQQPYPGFTQLWMLPTAQTGKNCTVHLGIHSFESTSVTYRITMTVQGVQSASWSTIVLAPQETWDQLVAIHPEVTNEVSVVAQLYRLDKPKTVYRNVTSIIYGCSTSQFSPNVYPSLARAYNGTIHDIPANLTTNISLTAIQQTGGSINGYIRIGARLQADGSFKGVITTIKRIQFMVTDDTQHVILSFDGAMQPGGILSGSYCTLDQQKRCNSRYGYGLWSVALASS